MHFIRSFFRRITNDLKQKKLIPLKILFFVHASTLFVLYPYLTIHMRELGINVEETAIMSAVTPVVSIVMPPLAGMLADKIGNFRLLLALSSVLGGLSALLLLLVPVGRLTVTFPPRADLLTSCSVGAADSTLHLLALDDYPCTPLHPYALDVNISVESCGFSCRLPRGVAADDAAGGASALLRTDHYVVSLHAALARQSAVYRYALPDGGGRHAPHDTTDHATSRIMTNDLDYKTTIRRLPDGGLFFPAFELYRMDCRLDETNNASCEFRKRGSLLDVELPPAGQTSLRARITCDVSAQEAAGRAYRIEAIRELSNETAPDPDYGGVDKVLCRDGFTKEESGEVSVWAAGMRLGGCAAGCVASAPRAQLCSDRAQRLEIDPLFTFWSYLAVRVFIGIISGTAFAMFEGAVIAILRDQQADYGLQRIYGSIGGMISSPLSGLLIDYASRGKGYTDFRPAFYLYAALKVMSGALMLGIDLEFKQPAQNLMEDVVSVFRNIELLALFMACFVMGTAWGYIESFLFWLLQDLGASRSLMGVTITVGGVAGLPLLVMSGPIIRRLGHANVLFIGFIFYAIRLMGYSLIYNPWLCLVFEALESVTSSLSFTAAVTYAARLSSATTDTSVQGLLGGIYYGVGKGSGSLIGGYLMKFFGTRETYRVFSVFTLLSGCVYYLFNRFYLRRRPQREANDIYKKKPKPLDVECHETSEKDKSGALYIEGVKTSTEKANSDSNPRANGAKKAIDSTDGGSDSGVDNLAYNDSDANSVVAADTTATTPAAVVSTPAATAPAATPTATAVAGGATSAAPVDTAASRRDKHEKT